LQIIVERNHGVLLYPSNASDYETTREHFGTVDIHSQELADAIINIDLDQELSKYQLTSDQQYLCKAMNTKLPLLPVVGKEENQLFEKLVLTAPQGPINFEQMAIEWCKNVDAVNIFPKLPVYLRTHYSKRQQNQCDAVAKAAPGEARLHEINAGFGIQSAATPVATMVPVMLPSTLLQPPGTLVQPVLGVIVGGTMVRGDHQLGGMTEIKLLVESPADPKLEPPKDGVGIVRRRRCKYCTQHGRSLEEASNCPGRGGWWMCTGGEGGVSLECVVLCNISIKCRCLS